MSDFIRLTQWRGGAKLPGLRLAVAHIVGYWPNEQGGSAVITSEGDDDVWNVAESCDEIDELIAAPGLFAPQGGGGA
jgi:hypothetical protein